MCIILRGEDATTGTAIGMTTSVILEGSLLVRPTGSQ